MVVGLFRVYGALSTCIMYQSSTMRCEKTCIRLFLSLPVRLCCVYKSLLTYLTHQSSTTRCGKASARWPPSKISISCGLFSSACVWDITHMVMYMTWLVAERLLPDGHAVVTLSSADFSHLCLWHISLSLSLYLCLCLYLCLRLRLCLSFCL